MLYIVREKDPINSMGRVTAAHATSLKAYLKRHRDSSGDPVDLVVFKSLQDFKDYEFGTRYLMKDGKIKKKLAQEDGLYTNGVLLFKL
mgnify:CR=1 FL=1|tara:strand:+ start:1511 stop:1774 length:264 start_codon:yes stop_codon:yes gene_type:complete